MRLFGRKKDVYDVIFGANAAEARAEHGGAAPAADAQVASVFGQSLEQLAQLPGPELERIALSALSDVRFKYDDGEKFPGGFGPTFIPIPDYWTLRARSAQLFETNIYGRGIIRRLITNELNTGLHLEATPEEKLLGKEEDALADWSEDVENRFALWAKDPYLCDHYERSTFGSLQAQARREALVCGDVLVVMRQDRRSRLPRIQLIAGASVQTPITYTEKRGANKVRHGVEIDPTGKHVAFWVQQEDGTYKRIPAFGEKSGRRLAWLVYGTDKRLDDVRGKPLLSLVLQSLREIDRYRDSTQRKAAVLAMLALFVSKAEAGAGTRPFAAGANRKVSVTSGEGTSTERTFRAQTHHPGMVIDELNQGEEPKAFQVNGTTDSFADFESAIIQSVAWTLGIPPEILTLSFSSNYSASQAAVNEFKQYLNEFRTGFGEAVCEPIYQEWLISSVLNGEIVAQGLLEAWGDYWRQHVIVNAWLSSDWSGNVKPAVDLSKLVDGYEKLVELGAISRDRMSRELTGTKFSKNVRKLKRENEQIAEANKPIAELKAAEKPKPPKPPPGFGGPDEGAPDNKPAKPPTKDSKHDYVVSTD